MRVSTVYLQSGEATTVSEGLCKTFFNSQQLTGLMCAAKVDDAGRRMTAIVTFDVAAGQAITLKDRLQPVTPGRTERFVADKNRDQFPDGSTFKTLPNGTRVATLPNGNKFEELSDGTTWIVLHPDGDFLGVRVDLNVMPAASSFHTEVIRNLPPSDILNAPQSVRLQVEGDCSSRTYSI